MQQYQDHLKHILTTGYHKPNRTGVDTLAAFGYQNSYDLQKGFPVLTTKKMHPRSVFVELLWFLKGDTNVKYLVDHDVHIWDDNAFEHNLAKMVTRGEVAQKPEKYSDVWQQQKKEYIANIRQNEEFAETYGDLGPVYGAQWRNWGLRGIDQLAQAVDRARQSPTSRRNIVTAWNPDAVETMALPPCHCFFQLNVREDQLDCQLYQRSADMFLGVPYNIVSYAALTQILAQEVGLKPGKFVHTFGDNHIYCGHDERGNFYKEQQGTLAAQVASITERAEFLELRDDLLREAPTESSGWELQDHVPMVLEQLAREPGNLPTLQIAAKSFEDLIPEDFMLTKYTPAPRIQAAMAV